MKRIAVFASLFSLVMAGSALSAPPVTPRTMTFPPLKFTIPVAERLLLENGMTVYLLEDHELPVVSVTAFIGAASAFDPVGKTGLAAFTGSVIRSGGTIDLPPVKMDDELEFMASTIESGIGMDVGKVSMNSLKKNLDRTLSIFSRLLMAPAFSEDRLELDRKKAIEALRRENDDPKQVADRELLKKIYQGSPLGLYPTVASLKSITRADVVAFHRSYFHPNNITLSIAGDFTRDEMLVKLNSAFAGWKKAPLSFPPVALPSRELRPAFYLVQKDINQSVIRMGHLGIDKNNPDIYALRVMDFILGRGGFESRLMSEIRTSQGLAYNVESDFSVGRRYPGTFVAETETKSESTAKVIGVMGRIIKGVTEQQVSDKELRQAKDSIISSFIFGFTSTASVVNQQAMLSYYGYPDGYLENYRDRIAGVTREDVLRVARKYLYPEAMILVIVGDGKKLDKPPSVFGKVQEIKLKEGE